MESTVGDDENGTMFELLDGRTATAMGEADKSARAEEGHAGSSTSGAAASEASGSTQWLCTNETRCAPSRNRIRHEIGYLQNVVRDLEEQLHKLRKERGQDPGRTAPEADVVSRQLQQRQRAQVENAQLRERIGLQLRLIKSLEQILKKRSVHDALMICKPTTRKRPLGADREPSILDDPGAFEELLSVVDEMHVMSGIVLDDPRFNPSITASLRDVRIRNDELVGILVEVSSTSVVPFTLSKAASAFWRQLYEPSTLPNIHEVVDASDDTIMKTSTVVVDEEKNKGVLRSKIAIRRWSQPQQTLFVWCAISDPISIAGNGMDGVVMRHRGWTIIRPVIHESRSLSHERVAESLSHICSYYTSNPEVVGDEVINHNEKLGALTSFVLNSVDAHLDGCKQMVENLVLES